MRLKLVQDIATYVAAIYAPFSKKRLEEIKEIEKRVHELPCMLVTESQFSDILAYIPNSILDASETANLLIKTKNIGEGIGFGIQYEITSNNPYVQIETSKVLGDVAPSNSSEVTLPISANLDAPDGKATITIYTKESRGYDTRPVEITIPVRYVEKPKLIISAVELNDANLGRAKGNGDGIPQNGETIELIAYVQNLGIGAAFGTTLDLVDLTKGVQKIVDHAEIGKIDAGVTEKAIVVVEIPRTFSGDFLSYNLVVKEARGACPDSEKNEKIEMIPFSPILTYDFIAPKNLKNGSSGEIVITPKNIGQLAAKNVVLQVTTTATDYGVELTNNTFNFTTFLSETKLESKVVKINVPRFFTEPTIPIKVEMLQKGFKGISEEHQIPIHVIKPVLKISDLSNLNEQVIQGQNNMELVLSVRNEGELAAENVQLSVSTSINYVKFKSNKAVIGTIPSGGKSYDKKFIFDVLGGVTPGNLPIQIEVTQSDFPNLSGTLNYQIIPWKPVPVPVQPDSLTPPPPPPPPSNQPPKISILNIEDGQENNDTPFKFVATIWDDQGFSSVIARLNGRNFYNSLRETGGSENPLIIQKELTPNTGRNEIEIVAIDNDNERESKEVIFTYKPVIVKPDSISKEIELYTLAVLPIESDHLTDSQKRAFTGALHSSFSVQDVATLVEKEKVNEILKQWAINASECVRSYTCKNIGELLQVEKLVVTDITKLDDNMWILNSRIIDVYDGTVHSETDKCSCSLGELDQSIEVIGRKIGNWLSKQYEDN